MATTEAPSPVTYDDTNAPPAAAPQTMTGLVSGIVSDAQTLLRQQADMLKAELKEDFTRSKRAAEFGALAIVFATVGALGLVTALAHVLSEQFQIHMSTAWAIVGGVFAAIGIACGAFSYILLERFNPLPDKTFNALKENVTWQNK